LLTYKNISNGNIQKILHVYFEWVFKYQYQSKS